MLLEHAAYHYRQPIERVACGSLLFRAYGHLQAVAAQAAYHLAVLWVVEIANHAACYHAANAVNVGELLQRCRRQRVHRPEAAGEQLGCRLADEPYAEGEHHPLERHLLRCLDALHNLAGRLFARASGIDVLHAYVVQVGHVAYQPPAEVFVHRLRAEAVNVHGLARYEVLYSPLYLRRAASVVGAVVGGLALVAHERRAALRAAVNKPYRLHARRARLGVNAHNLRYYLASLLHIHVVAQVKVEAAYEVLVVQRGAAHRSAGQLHRLHVGHWRHRARAPHLEGHLGEPRALALGLELVGYRPARALRRVAQGALLPQRIYLEHYAVGGHGQLLAGRVPVGYVVHYFLQAVRLAHRAAYLEAPAGGLLQVLVVAVARQLVAEQVVQVGVEVAAGHESRALALERAAGGVARVGEERLLGGLALGVEPLEHAPGHKYLAANLKLARVAAARQHERYGAYGLHVVGHVVALHPVAARHGLHQPPADVGKADGQPVVLQLAAHLERLAAKPAAYRLVPLGHVLSVVGVGQREHRVAVGHLAELLADVTAHALRWRRGVGHFGVACLEGLQLAHHRVKLLVADCRLAEHVVIVVMFVQLLAQLQYPFLFVHVLPVVSCLQS